MWITLGSVEAAVSVFGRRDVYGSGACGGCAGKNEWCGRPAVVMESSVGNGANVLALACHTYVYLPFDTMRHLGAYFTS